MDVECDSFLKKYYPSRKLIFKPNIMLLFRSTQQDRLERRKLIQTTVQYLNLGWKNRKMNIYQNTCIIIDDID